MMHLNSPDEGHWGARSAKDDCPKFDDGDGEHSLLLSMAVVAASGGSDEGILKRDGSGEVETEMWRTFVQERQALSVTIITTYTKEACASRTERSEEGEGDDVEGWWASRGKRCRVSRRVSRSVLTPSSMTPTH